MKGSPGTIFIRTNVPEITQNSERRRMQRLFTKKSYHKNEKISPGEIFLQGKKEAAGYTLSLFKNRVAMLDRRVDFKNKFHFTSLGCARNLVDSEVMIGLLLKSGYECVRPH